MVLRHRDERSNPLRNTLGLHQRGEVVTWYEYVSGEREFVVEADGYGSFARTASESRNPNDRLEHHRTVCEDEDAAGRTAMRLGEHGVAWQNRDPPVPEEDD